MPDEIIECIDCKTNFEFTESEQDFYATKTDQRTGQPFSRPKRCRPCRIKKKSNRGGNFQTERPARREDDRLDSGYGY